MYHLKFYKTVKSCLAGILLQLHAYTLDYPEIDPSQV